MVIIKIELLSIFLLIFRIESCAQIDFEKGYFIDLNNQRTECLIRNHEWKNNPVDFEYKLEEGDPIQKGNASAIREFGITNQSKYVGTDINIDRSKDDLSVLTYEKNPVWLRERQFLKVLIEGDASLLYYADGNLQRYFYQVNDTIKQLVYKKYLGENKELLINNNFRQQLWAEVNAEMSLSEC